MRNYLTNNAFNTSKVVVFLKVPLLRDTLTPKLKALALLGGVSEFWTRCYGALNDVLQKFVPHVYSEQGKWGGC